MKAFPYQEIGVNFLTSRRTACLWDDPGLGKTFQTILGIIQNKFKNVLIICPASVRLVWTDEFNKMGIPSTVILRNTQLPKSGVIICSYDGAAGALYSKLMSQKYDLVVLDEGHYLKGNKSKRTRRIFGEKFDRKDCIAGNSENVWSLTGTPMPNNPAELYPTLRALFPDAIAHFRTELPLTYWQFVGRYCKTIDNGFGIQIIGGKNLDKLRDALRGRIMRRKKSMVLKDLPEMRYEKLPVQANLRGLDPDELETIKKCLDAENPLAELKKMDTHVASIRRITGMSKVKPVIDWVKDSNLDKIVLFAHHKDVIRELAENLDSCVVVDGSCTQDQRRDAVEAFQNGDAKVFIGQIHAAGTGLTLTAASTMVFVEYDWVPANNKQASDRIHRIGQEDSCLVYFATVPDSIDDQIMDVVKRKLETYDQLGL